ncbi:MAG: anti-sigma factor family protein [Candidatus Saccharicenans sp.]
MSCPKVEDIYAYLENELSDECRKELENHFRCCSRCQKILADQQAYLQALSGLPDYELPSEFTSEVINHLPQLQSPPKVWLVLAGGAYFFFGLMAITLFSGIKNFLSSLSLDIFRNIFHSAVYLSQVISQAFQLIFGLVKTAKITLGVIGASLLNFWSGKIISLMILGLPTALTLMIFWLLLKSFQSSNPGGNHES